MYSNFHFENIISDVTLQLNLYNLVMAHCKIQYLFRKRVKRKKGCTV